MTASAWTTYDSPLGPLTLTATADGLTGVHFPDDAPSLRETDRDPAAFTEATGQLDEYFAGRRRRFDLPLDLGGTAFQRSVWDALAEIPYGARLTYTALADRVGRPGSVRAVGAAVGRTPAPIVVPCHRVVGADGSLTGYRGGLERKRALLELEETAPDRR